MKHLATLTLFLGLAACGANNDSSVLSRCKTKAPKLYTFSLDARPLDGNFQTIVIKMNQAGSYDASYHLITSGFGSPVTDTTGEIGTNLECVQNKKGRILNTLTCALDLRPADGLLIELTMTRNENGGYDATVHKAAYGTLQGPELDETTPLGFNLTYIR